MHQPRRMILPGRVVAAHPFRFRWSQSYAEASSELPPRTARDVTAGSRRLFDSLGPRDELTSLPSLVPPPIAPLWAFQDPESSGSAPLLSSSSVSLSPALSATAESRASSPGRAAGTTRTLRPRRRTVRHGISYAAGCSISGTGTRALAEDRFETECRGAFLMYHHPLWPPPCPGTVHPFYSRPLDRDTRALLPSMSRLWGGIQRAVAPLKPRETREAKGSLGTNRVYLAPSESS